LQSEYQALSLARAVTAARVRHHRPEAYRKLREFGWLSGMALLALRTVFGFSGYELPQRPGESSGATDRKAAPHGTRIERPSKSKAPAE
jgi:hypothetical protein